MFQYLLQWELFLVLSITEKFSTNFEAIKFSIFSNFPALYQQRETITKHWLKSTHELFKNTALIENTLDQPTSENLIK